jgi:hypothetical protein
MTRKGSTSHPDAYQYCVSLSIADGKRFDMNDVLGFDHRDGVDLVVTKEAAATAMAVFKQENSKNRSCLDSLAVNDEYLELKAFTMTVRPSGSLQLYFDTSYAEAACFNSIRLIAQQVHPLRNTQRANANSLP